MCDVSGGGLNPFVEPMNRRNTKYVCPKVRVTVEGRVHQFHCGGVLMCTNEQRPFMFPGQALESKIAMASDVMAGVGRGPGRLRCPSRVTIMFFFPLTSNPML